MWPESTTETRQRQCWRIFLTGALLCAVLMSTCTQTWAEEFELPPMCSIDNTQDTPTADGSMAPDDCYEFGASVGELGWSWRRKLPSHVRWVTRKDAQELCAQTSTEFGQKVAGLSSGACVFLAPAACTIVSSGPISSAAIGNAVRDCVP